MNADEKALANDSRVVHLVVASLKRTVLGRFWSVHLADSET